MQYFICFQLSYPKYQVNCVVSIIAYYFKFELDRVIIGSGQTRIWVGLGLGHSCLGWIGSGFIWFVSFWVLGLHWVNKISGQFGWSSTHFGFRVKSVQYGFELDWFWVHWILGFGSRLVQFFQISVQVWFRVIRFELFGLFQFCYV